MEQYESSEFNALVLALRTNTQTHGKSQKLYRNEQGDNWTLEANDNFVTVGGINEPHAFPGKSPSVEISYDDNLDNWNLAMHIYSEGGGYSIQTYDTPMSSFF